MREASGASLLVNLRVWRVSFRGKECRTTIVTAVDMVESIPIPLSSFGGIVR